MNTVLVQNVKRGMALRQGQGKVFLVTGVRKFNQGFNLTFIDPNRVFYGQLDSYFDEGDELLQPFDVGSPEYTRMLEDMMTEMRSIIIDFKSDSQMLAAMIKEARGNCADSQAARRMLQRLKEHAGMAELAQS